MAESYRRILLKLSGEALGGPSGKGIDAEVAGAIAQEIAQVRSDGVQIGIVLGGGNIFRGVSGTAEGFPRVVGDTVGMLATVINGLLFREILLRHGVPATVLTATRMEKVADLHTPQRAIEELSAGNVVIMAGGSGNPFFTTDTAAALRAAETECDALLKATKVDGIYDHDPVKNPKAVKLLRLTHQEALARGIQVMDSAAFSLCMENEIPIVVFRLTDKGALQRCVRGEPVGSMVYRGE